MMSSALLAAALAAATAQTKPEAVVLTSSPFITRPALTSTRTVAIYQSNAAVRAHLTQRIRETWGIEVDATPPITPTDGTFYIHLDWPSPQEVVVGVALPEQTLAERSIEVEDLDATAATVWLLVQSTVERALLSPAAIANEQPPPAAPEAPLAVVEGAAPIAGRGPKRYALSVMALTNFDTGAGVQATPSFQGQLFLHRWLIVGAELSFRHESRTETTNIYHVPLTGFVSAHPWEELPLELGLFTTLDAKVVSLPNSGGGMSAGFYVGPFVRGRWSFYSFGSSSFSIVGDAGLAFALKRDRYYVGNETMTDGVVAFRLAGGLEWSWH